MTVILLYAEVYSNKLTVEEFLSQQQISDYRIVCCSNTPYEHTIIDFGEVSDGRAMGDLCFLLLGGKWLLTE